MEVDLSRPVLDVVVPRDGTPLSLSHMNSVTWADLLTELGAGQGGVCPAGSLSATHPLVLVT